MHKKGFSNFKDNISSKNLILQNIPSSEGKKKRKKTSGGQSFGDNMLILELSRTIFRGNILILEVSRTLLE